jgi:hypothetical protein
MNNQLKFNICGIPNTSLLNDEVEDLHTRINRCISEVLRYSCRFFVEHLAVLRDVGVILDALEEFVSKHLLHWIETMSWLGEISRAESCLQTLASWMKVGMNVLVL